MKLWLPAFKLRSASGYSGEDNRFYNISGIISNDNIDTYHSIMDPETTLPNYARDAKAGVPFFVGHDYDGLGIGKTTEGTLANKQVSVEGQLSARNTRAQEIIIALEDGLNSDFSVGFDDDDSICNLCDEPIWGIRTTCEHFPGEQYEDYNDEVCTYTIKNARLTEVSFTPYGSCPGSIVDKVERHRNKLSGEGFNRLRHIYRIPNRTKTVDFGNRDNSNNTEENEMELRELQAELDVREAKAKKEREAEIKPLTDAITSLTDKVETLEKKVNDPERAQLITDYAKETVRAYGEDVGTEEELRSTAEKMESTTLRVAVRQAKAIADAKLGKGRRSEDDTEEEDEYEPTGAN